MRYEMRTTQKILLLAALSLLTDSCYALDSYRYMHVSLDTLWYIFVGLLVVILLPFILMAILAWKISVKKANEKKAMAAAVKE